MQDETKFLLLMVVFILLTPVFGTIAAYLLYGIAYSTVYVTGHALVDLALGAASLWTFFICLGNSFKYWHRATPFS